MEMKTEDTPVRCDGMEEDGAPFSSPYRHYARVVRREIRTRITRAARWGHRALPPLHTCVPWCGPIAMTPSCCGNKTMIYSTSTMPRHLGYLQQPKNFLPVSREVRSTMALPHRGQSGASVSDTGLCVFLRLFTCADIF